MSQISLYRTVYDVLDAVRRRPGMFLGGKSIALLQAFESGLSFSHLDPGTPSFWNFSQWFSVRAGLETTFPWRELEEQAGVEQAVDLYFKYLDEFRTNTWREIASASPPFHPNFVALVGGERVDPEIPHRIVLGTMDPSGVVFLCEQYAERAEPETSAYASISAAQAAAEEKWQVATERWRR